MTVEASSETRNQFYFMLIFILIFQKTAINKAPTGLNAISRLSGEPGRSKLTAPRRGHSANHCAALCRFERHCPPIVSPLIFKIKEEPLITSLLFYPLSKWTVPRTPPIPLFLEQQQREQEKKKPNACQHRAVEKERYTFSGGSSGGIFENKVLMQLPITPCVSSPVHLHLCLKIRKGSASSSVVVGTKGVKVNLRHQTAAVKLMTDCSSARGVTMIRLLFFSTQREPEQKSYRFHNESIFNEMAAARVRRACSGRRLRVMNSLTWEEAA